jgi:hypothetical protein
MNPYDCLLIYALPYQMVTNAIIAVYCLCTALSNGKQCYYGSALFMHCLIKW